MNGISLCAGVGGIDLGLRLVEPSYRTVAYCEIEAFPKAILAARMSDGLLDAAPIWDNVKSFDGKPWRGLVDLVHGGYPCQPFSVAGKQLGVDDPRHLWPDIARVVRECAPEWCFFENVGGHLRLGFDVVARDLVDMGYRVAAGLFTAAEVGASHRRERLYILGHAERAGLEGLTRRGSDGTGWSWSVAPKGCVGVVHPHDPRLEGRGEPLAQHADELPAWPPGPEERAEWRRVLEHWPNLAPATVADAALVQRRRSGVRAGGDSQGGRGVPELGDGGAASSIVADASYGDAWDTRRGSGAWWSAKRYATEPDFRRMAHGLARRVDRLKALGNGVVPAVAAHAWITLRKELLSGA